jgi:Flp pilus assembly pilin Flp
MLRNLLKSRQGQGLVEYALLVAGVSLAAIVGVSLMGEKTADMIAAVATVLPGADTDDNGPITVGHLIETSSYSTGGNPISIDLNQIQADSGTSRLSNNFASGFGSVSGFDGLINDPVPGASGAGT